MDLLAHLLEESQAFYGRRGNVALRTTDNIVTGNITSSGHIIAASANFTGNVSIGKTLTYEDVTQVDAVGLSTFQNGLVVKPGTATTALIVEGDARISGILTVGQGSITIDPDNDIVNIGGSQLQRDSGGDLMLMAEGTSNYSPFRASKFLIDATEVIDNSRVGKNFSKIGIGTDNPIFPIEVKAAQPALRLYDTDATNAYTNITNLNGNMYLGARNDSSDGVLLFGGYGGNTFTEFFRKSSSTAFSIDTNGNERFRINSVGNVGIGTNAPGMKVHVESGTPYIRSKNTAAPSDEKSWDFNAGTDGILRFRNTNDAANSSNNWLEVERDGVSTHSIRLLTGIGTERVRIDSNGKFGLGTNNPQALLDVEQTTQGEVARFRASNSTRYLKISSFDSGFNGSGFDFNATSNTGEISFSTEDVEKVRIDNDGNFGIGTNNPSHKLDVVGNTQLYGTLVIGDNTDISPTENGAAITY